MRRNSGCGKDGTYRGRAEQVAVAGGGGKDLCCWFLVSGCWLLVLGSWGGVDDLGSW
jgi:hypothetical protein